MVSSEELEEVKTEEVELRKKVTISQLGFLNSNLDLFKRKKSRRREKEEEKSKQNEKKKKPAPREETVRRSTNQFKKLERGTQTCIGYYKVRDQMYI